MVICIGISFIIASLFIYHKESPPPKKLLFPEGTLVTVDGKWKGITYACYDNRPMCSVRPFGSNSAFYIELHRISKILDKQER